MKLVIGKSLVKSLILRVAKISDKGNIGFEIDDDIFSVQTIPSNDTAATATLDTPATAKYRIKKEDRSLEIEGYSEPVVFGISADMICRSISLVKDAVVTFEIGEKSITIYGNKKRNKSTLPILEIPDGKLPLISKGMVGAISFGYNIQKFENFSNPFNRTIVATSKNKDKLILQGVAICIDGEKKQVTSIATDSSRLHEKILPVKFDDLVVQENEDKEPISISKLSEEEQTKIFNKIYVVSSSGLKAASSFYSNDELVIMSVSESFTKFSGSDPEGIVVTELYMRNLVGNYPAAAKSLSKILFDQTNKKFVCQKSNLKEELTNAAAFASTGKLSSKTLLHFKKGAVEIGLEVRVTGTNSAYESSIAVEKETDKNDFEGFAEDMTICFNPSLLSDLIESFSGNKLIVNYSDASHPFVIQDHQMKEPLGMITPIVVK